MTAEPFATGNSWLHHIDPRLRIAFAIVISIPVSIFNQLNGLLAAMAFSFLLIGLARLNPTMVIKRLLPLFGFLLFLWMVLPFTVDGEATFIMGPFSATREGVVLSTRISIKSITIVSCLTALVATMNVAVLGQALAGLGMPPKMVQLLLLTYRYIHVIGAEFQRLARAARVRRFKPGTNLHSYKTYAYMLGMLFVRASLRAERVHQAMRCRGFKGRFYSLKRFPPHIRNWSFSVLMALAVAILCGLEWGHWI